MDGSAFGFRFLALHVEDLAMSSLPALLATVIALVTLFVLCVVARYTITTYNDLSRRLERLKGLLADVQRIRHRGRAVRGSVSRHVRTATRHEQRAIGNAARRGGRGGRLLNIQDTSNGWPVVTAVGSTERGLSADIETQDREQHAWAQLHVEAQQYNALLPSSLVAHTFGFRPWRMNAQRRWNNRSGRRGPNNRRKS
jgi:hypothetical protein